MINKSHGYFERLSEAFYKIDTSKIELFKKKIKKMMGTPRTLFIAGNGGSSAISSHMVCDLSKTILGKHQNEKINRLRAHSLNENIPTITAWANDFGYEYIFSGQFRSMGKKGDLLLVITGSGNSKNILEVVKEAKKMKIETFGFLGFDGGKVKSMLDNYLIVPSFDYGVVEDIHGILNHIITDSFKELLK